MSRLLFRLSQLSRQFWFVPALMTLAALLLAELGIHLEERYGVLPGLSFVYGGGETGSRSLLSAIASSSIGVAGTVFSITIAALSYAAGSMGPRLLDNFTRDRGNQVTLGTFIATFAFSLYTLRSVQGGEDVPFVPHYNVTFALLLALGCIAALVYYLAHVTGNINMTRVVNLLRNDLRLTLEEVTRPDAEASGCRIPPPDFWEGSETLRATGGGYLQQVDIAALTQRAAQAGTVVRLLVRTGDYVFPHMAVAQGQPVLPPRTLDTLLLGDERVSRQDLEYSVRQLTEVAARALSPSTNDPVTAIDVIDRFGDALCSLRDREWPNGCHVHGGELRLIVPTTDFTGLVNTMFRPIRQYGAGDPAVVIRFLEVVNEVALCLRGPERRRALLHHADLMVHDAMDKIENPSDRADVQERYGRVRATIPS